MIATIDTVKLKLGIALGRTDRNGEIETALAAAEQRLLKLARLTEDEQTVTESFLAQQEEKTIQTRLRPVSEITVAQARMERGDWQDVTVDILDADEGVIVLRGAAAGWPPILTDTVPAVTWSALRVTYVATGVATDPPDALSDTIAALAAYWVERHRAGASSSVGAGPLRETFMTVGIPDWVTEAIAGFTTGTGGGAGWV